MSAIRAEGEVRSNRALGSLTWLTVRVPGWPGARPGQFALLQAGHSACFLGRALSVADQNGEEVSFLIAPVGAGTRELAQVGPGASLWVLGPLGTGFDLAAMGWAVSAHSRDRGTPGASGRLILVGGGVGVAPLPLLLRSAIEGGGDGEAEILVLLGFRDRAQAGGEVPVRKAVEDLPAARVRCRLEVALEDGSAGPPATVTNLLERELRPGDRLAVCGPWAMTEAVWRVCSTVPAVAAWFSLEAGMACGVGSCHGCAILLAGGKTARVCHEGPVFAGEVLFGGAGRTPPVQAAGGAR